MGTTVRTFQAALRVDAGTQDITFGGETRTPTGLVIFANRADTLNTNTAMACLSIGYSDFTSQFCTTGNAEDGSLATDTAGRQRNDVVISIDDEGAATDDKTATVAAITGGIRLTANAGDGSETFEIAGFMVFEAECKAFGTGNATSAGSSFNVTHGLSQKPNFGILSTAKQGISDGGAGTWSYSLGFFTDHGTIVQKCISYAIQSAQADGEAHGKLWTNRVAVETSQIGGSTAEVEYTVTDNDATNTEITCANNIAEDVLGLLVYSKDVVAQIQSIDSPNSAGSDWNVNSFNITGQFAMLLPSVFTAEDTHAEDSALAGAGGVWAFDENGGEISLIWTDRNGVTTTQSYSRTDDKLFFMDDTRTTLYDLTNPSFTSDGFDVANADITTASATTHKFLGLEVEAARPKVLVRSSAGNNDPNDVSPELDSPADIVAGDLLVAIWIINDSATQTITPPTGWTEQATGNNVATDRRFVLFTKTATSTDVTNKGTSDYYVFSGMNGTDDIIYAIFSLYDPEGGTVEYKASSFATSIETDHDTTTDAPSQTISVDGSLVIAAYTNGGASAFQISTNNTFTEGRRAFLPSNGWTSNDIANLTMAIGYTEFDTADSPTGVLTLGHADLDNATAVGQFAMSATFQISPSVTNTTISIPAGPIR